jgi:hypothetical protein
MVHAETNYIVYVQLKRTLRDEDQTRHLNWCLHLELLQERGPKRTGHKSSDFHWFRISDVQLEVSRPKTKNKKNKKNKTKQTNKTKGVESEPGNGLAACPVPSEKASAYSSQAAECKPMTYILTKSTIRNLFKVTAEKNFSLHLSDAQTITFFRSRLLRAASRFWASLLITCWQQILQTL